MIILSGLWPSKMLAQTFERLDRQPLGQVDGPVGRVGAGDVVKPVAQMI